MAQAVDVHHDLAAAPARRFAHNPALDGFRGIAVLVVVLYHTGLLTGGWIGVEMFFVLSGYLITSLLVIEMDSSGRIDLVAFWRRRARRLLPALYVLLAVVAFFVRFVSQPTAYASVRRDIWAALTYSSNWVAIYGGGGYWQQFQAPSPLHHMWSLAVEEQFYLIFPLLAVVILRARCRNVVLPTLAALALAWQVWMTHHASLDRFYLGTDTRAFGILLGACIALVESRPVRRSATYLAPIALAFLAFAIWTLDGTSVGSFHGPFQLVTLSTGVVVLSFAGGGTGVLARGVSIRWLTIVGTWSYAIYLVHWPLAELLRQRYQLSPWPVTLIVLPISLILAAVSHRLIESPIRRRGLRAFGRPLVPLLLGFTFAVTAVTATYVGVRSEETAADVAQVVAPTVVPAATDVPTLPSTPRPVGIVPRPDGRPYRIMLVGDSVGASLKQPLDELAPDVGIEVFSRAAASCSYDRDRTSAGPGFTEDQSCVDIVNGWAADVASFRPDLVLFVYGSWTGWAYQGSYRTQCDEVLAQHVDDLYGQAVRDLGSFGAPVYFVSAGYWRLAGSDASGDGDFDCLRTVMRTFVDQHPTTTAYVDVASLVCAGHDCDATSGGQPVRTDGLHYSGPGAITVAEFILQHSIEPDARGWPATPPIECC